MQGIFTGPMKKLFPFLILLFLHYYCQALPGGAVKGIVTDKATGDPLVGATVTLKNHSTGNKTSTSVGLDGSFQFKFLADGSYEVEAKYVSYKDTEEEVTVANNTVTVRLSLQRKTHDLNEVTIAGGRNAGSDQAARKLEQRSDQVLNAVSARSIEVSPDITIANVTQRISGVSVERSNNGEAQYAIIRGMDQRYQYTLINGIKIPSPSNTNRYVPLDIFPADIVDRLEVYKSLTPGMEGDAIGGAINLALKDAPDDFAVNVNVGTGYAETFFNGGGFTKFDHSASLSRSPRATNGSSYLATTGDFPNNPLHYSNLKTPLASIFGLSVGGRSRNKKFGALLAGSYQNTYRETNSIFFNTQVDANTTGNPPEVTSVQRRIYDIQQQRTAIIGKLDYKFNASNKLTLNGSYINLTQNEYRFASDTSLQLGRVGIGTGRITQDYRSDRTVQRIYNVNLQGDHYLLPNLRLNWMAVYSKATANEPDRTDLNTNTGVTLSNGAFSQGSYYFATNAITHIFSRNSDQDKTGYLNLFYTPVLFNTKIEFSAGGMYRDKERHSEYDEYDLRASTNTSTAQQFNGHIDENSFYVFNPEGTATNALNYNFTEKVAAGYGQFKFTTGRLQTIGGVRYEHTSQDWLTAAPESVTGRYGNIHYDDLLPSLNFKYALTDKQNIRLTYYSAISRPNFFELVPHVVGDPDADYQQVGNPNLKRITAENFDLRYELFPKGLDQLLVGVFYKSIDNPIEYALIPYGTSFALQPNNFGSAHNYGFELDFTKYFNKFGVRANYTYTDSRITTTKISDYLTNTTARQTRPLQGQSKNIGNLSFLYRDGKSGLDAQLSLVYTGSRIDEVSPYLNNDVWQKSFTTLDFSVQKRLFKNLYGYVKATNLLNTPYELEIHRPYPDNGQTVEYQQAGKNTFVRRDSYRQYFLAGLRYKL